MELYPGTLVTVTQTNKKEIIENVNNTTLLPIIIAHIAGFMEFRVKPEFGFVF